MTSTWTRRPLGDAATYRRLVHEHGSPLRLVHLDRARAAYDALSDALPNVELYYAVKSCPEPSIITTLRDLGCKFDVASSGEVGLLAQLGIGGRSTIHTHPIKTDAEIRAALRFGCTTFVVDNPFELQKLARYRNRVGVLLRIGHRSESAVVDLSRKFGCAPEEAGRLLLQAQSIGVHVKGLCFHVGSQCANAKAHARAIEICNTIIRAHEDNGGTPMRVLDIGGGFPVDYDGKGVDLAEFCAPIRTALKSLPEHLNVIAEPGRVISAPAMEVVTSVIGKSMRDDRQWCYFDDGVYGSFSGKIFDHCHAPMDYFAEVDGAFPSVLAGPTCDSIDILAEDVHAPDFGLGDFIVARSIGAYSSATATTFNMLPQPKLVVLDPAADDAANLGLGSIPASS
jgi:ornithine decarboxylase